MSNRERWFVRITSFLGGKQLSFGSPGGKGGVERMLGVQREALGSHTSAATGQAGPSCLLLELLQPEALGDRRPIMQAVIVQERDLPGCGGEGLGDLIRESRLSSEFSGSQAV